MTPQERALRCAAAMTARGGLKDTLGIKLMAIQPGRARMSMPVDERTMNGMGTCHGGSIFALADTALAYAANSHNRVAVTKSCDIDFRRPGAFGALLVADAEETARDERAASFHVRIVDADGTEIAICTGKVRLLDGQVFPE